MGDLLPSAVSEAWRGSQGHLQATGEPCLPQQEAIKAAQVRAACRQSQDTSEGLLASKSDMWSAAMTVAAYKQRDTVVGVRALPGAEFCRTVDSQYAA